MSTLAIIYVLKCQKTGKKYVGQTRTHKKIRGEWYKYGINQRFVEHIGAARRQRTTPIAKALRKYGKELFEIAELEKCSIKLADQREAFWIDKYNTLVPHGYNVQETSRSRKGNLYVKGNVTEAEIKGIKRNGTLAQVRVLLIVEGRPNRKRITFGNTPKTYSQSLEEARIICSDLTSNVIEHSSLFESQELWWPYKEKLDQFEAKQVSRIRIVLFNKHLVRVCVKTSEMKSWKEEVRMTFGGKTLSTQKAFDIAFSVASELASRHNTTYTIDERLNRCQQQVVALKDE